MRLIQCFVHLIGLAVLTLPSRQELSTQGRSGDGGLNNSTCGTGFRKIRFSGKCVDINECRKTRPCKGYQARCGNIRGSYRCRCRNKMQGNGIDACGYIIPFHQIVKYPDFSPITNETIVGNPPPGYIRRRESQLKISINLQAKQGISSSNIISKITIKTVTPIHPRREMYNITYDVYFKENTSTPEDFIRLLAKTRNKSDPSDRWKFGVSNPIPEWTKCSPITVGLGWKRIRFGTSKAPSIALSLDTCPGTNHSRASIRCRIRKYKDGTKTATYAYRSLVMSDCSERRMITPLPSTTLPTTTLPTTETSKVAMATIGTVTSTTITATTKETGIVVDSSTGIFTEGTEMASLPDKTAANSTTFYQTTSTIATITNSKSFNEPTDAQETIELTSIGYNTPKAHGIDIDAMIKEFIKSLSDPAFRATKEAFVKGKEIMNTIFLFVDQSETFELSSSSMGSTVSMMDLLIENPAGVEVTEEENLELALSFEKLSTRVKLEGDELFSVDSQSLSLQVSKMDVEISSSGDGTISQFENSQGKKTNFSSALAYLPSEAIRKASEISSFEEPKAAFTLFKNSSLFSTKTVEFEDVELSQVLSASAGGIGIQNLSENFWYQMPFEVNGTEGKSRRYFKCAFFDEVKKAWSTEGCHFVPDSNPPNCTCNHLTNFALIVKSVRLPEQFVLDIIGKVGCSISIIGLVWMMGCYLSSPSLLKNKINQVHAHLGLSLLAAYIVFLAGVENTDTRNGCIAIAAVLHFLLLSSWGWMTVECITMYRKLVSVLGHTGSTYIMASGTVVYGGAITIVTVTLGVTIGWYDKQYFVDWNPEPNDEHAFKTLYVSERLCWLQGDPLTFGFLVPIALAFSLNLFAFIRISKAITCDRKKIRSSRKTTPIEEVKDYLIRAVVITFLFGLTWIFAIPLTATDDHITNLIFSWLFSIFNSLQGFFIFFFFCVRRKDVRGLWMKGFNKLTRRYATRKAVISKNSQQFGVSMTTVNSTYSENKQKRNASNL